MCFRADIELTKRARSRHPETRRIWKVMVSGSRGGLCTPWQAAVPRRGVLTANKVSNVFIPDYYERYYGIHCVSTFAAAKAYAWSYARLLYDMKGRACVFRAVGTKGGYLREGSTLFRVAGSSLLAPSCVYGSVTLDPESHWSVGRDRARSGKVPKWLEMEVSRWEAAPQPRKG